jgi:hypothetical protein
MPIKIKLFLNISLDKPQELEVQYQNLLSNYSEIEKILELKKDNISNLKLLYFNRINIHAILYQNDKVIYLDNNIDNLGNYFYLDLLILDNVDLINYSYSKTFILKIDKILERDKSKIVNKVFLSKVNIDLINNYKGSENYNENEEEKELLEKENVYKKIIRNNMNIFKELKININENDIYKKKIDELYIEIIKGLIITCKFEDYEYTYNIMQQLDMLSIDITKNMFNELSKVLKDEEEHYIKKYKISTVNDLFNVKNINFFFVLIKYILKDSIYIHQIPFLLKTRKNVITFINNNLIEIWKLKENISNDEIKERIDFIIEKITDSEYYIQKYKGDKFFKERYPIIKYVFDLEQEKENNEEELKKYFEDWMNIEKMIKDKKINEIDKKIKIKLINYCKNDLNKKIIINIFKENEYNYLMKEFNNSTDCINEDIKDKENNKENNEEKNLKKHSDIINNNKEQSDIIINACHSINVKNSKKEESSSSIIIESLSIYNKNDNESNNKNYSSINKEKNDLSVSYLNEYDNMLNINSLYAKELNLFKKPPEYEIISFIKLIGNHQIAEHIINLSNGYYISGGTNNKLILYNKLFENILEIKLDQYPYNIYEINNNKNKNELKIFACCNEEISLITIDIKNIFYKVMRYDLNTNCSSMIQLERDDYIIMGENGVTYMNDFFNTNNNKKIANMQIMKEYYRGGIQINKDIIALTYNNIITDRIDKLIFYNIYKKKIIKKIEGFSFVITSHGLMVYNQNNVNNNILLCACKQYNLDQKNGILLVNINTEERKENFDYCFYDTDDFEVHCFCLISDVKNNNPINGDITVEDNIKICKSNLFLVGGFDKEKGDGVIKLYKLLENEKDDGAYIEYLQDIVIQDFRFEKPISCITQSNITGNILITCWDGNVYLFKPPNIDFFLNYTN